MPQDLQQAIAKLQLHLRKLREDDTTQAERIRRMEKIIEDLETDLKNSPPKPPSLMK